MIFGKIGALCCFLSVALGAFAAHGLKSKLASELLQTFEVGARYQMYHGIALVLVSLLLFWSPKDPFLTASGILFIIGIILFSGSLYLLVLTGIKWLGAITPLGGMSFLAGWVLLFLSFKK